MVSSGDVLKVEITDPAAGFTTIVQPAASAGPAFRVIIAEGKFQGVIAAQTPIGSFKTTMRLSGPCAGIVSP